jgi:hypothetical protein
MAIYTRDNVAANDPIDISISGQGPAAPPEGAVTAPGDESQNPSVNSRTDSGGTDSPTATAIAIPARIDGIKWILVGGFGAIFLLGFGYLLRKPVPAAVTAGAATTVAPTAAPPAAKPAAREAIASLEDQARGGLDALKDSLFRLELRRQAGTLSEDEYAQERARVEKVLHDLVKG